ncbi:hypothetical protein LMH87_006568 [Akanthomyces muscarius]|uniref:Uncharacterized protein n=1 Tax=Akanthomyces muscarius TaxID=2231603 RepID=A0A9W8QPU9_AKAMU|nr:hypothetical protein LMH87_006568 [Akanthomyces muscarius]KAJ4164915.1 hypothetical protein LMH87_006568 [Akanthomyces muscarius]
MRGFVVSSALASIIMTPMICFDGYPTPAWHLRRGWPGPQANASIGPSSLKEDAMDGWSKLQAAASAW